VAPETPVLSYGQWQVVLGAVAVVVFVRGELLVYDLLDGVVDDTFRLVIAAAGALLCLLVAATVYLVGLALVTGL
jgi:hypothetical protein